jgi:hypothetical protein
LYAIKNITSPILKADNWVNSWNYFTYYFRHTCQITHFLSLDCALNHFASKKSGRCLEFDIGEQLCQSWSVYSQLFALVSIMETKKPVRIVLAASVCVIASGGSGSASTKADQQDTQFQQRQNWQAIKRAYSNGDISF